MMHEKRGLAAVRGLLVPVAAAAVLLCFLTALSNLACYAAEGIYPPDLAYLEEHYGIQIDESRYTVYYDIFGSNLMPDITVLENET